MTLVVAIKALIAIADSCVDCSIFVASVEVAVSGMNLLIGFYWV
jgi:hypothetical protein